MMKKVIVIGCSGSGKSVFSRSFAQKTGLPLYHLDNIWWRADGTTVERDEFDRALGEILARDEWILDGNFDRTMERRMQACDTVIFFDIPTEQCLEGIKARKGKERPDMPWKNAPEDQDPEFVKFIRDFDHNRRPHIIELLKKYGDKNIVIFNSREEADAFIENIE